MSRVLSPRQIWAVPVVLGVLSLVGLVAALVADGWGDGLSALALAVPAGVSLWGFRRRHPEPAVAGPPPPPARRVVRPALPPRR
ncbi:hypothetical protein [Rubrivirga sp. IMCC43871]|uniref:hypothetical protein n=1 Tax=Rubrivirga sp. IMCC43871 TaxID=3391575 RepID=UPI00398FC048